MKEMGFLEIYRPFQGDSSGGKRMAVFPPVLYHNEKEERKGFYGKTDTPAQGG